jgi:hypothetical protein
VTQKAKRKASPSPAKRQSERHGVQSGGSATAIGDEDSSKKSQSRRRRRRRKRAKPSKQRKERSTLALPFLWMGALGVGLALAWVLAAGSMPQAVTADPNSSPAWWATGLSVEEPKQYLAQAYPPSRAAWVSEGPLLIRSGPSTENEYLGMLEAGAGVLVEDYSTDAEWSRLSQPKQGWVSNQFLNFLSETEPSTAILLGVRLGYVARENAVILPAPEPDLALQDTLPVGTSVIAIAVTTDNQWIQIAEPTAGWLQAAEVRFADE